MNDKNDLTKGNVPEVENPYLDPTMLASILGRSVGQGLSQLDPTIGRVVTAADTALSDLARMQFYRGLLMSAPAIDRLMKKVLSIYTSPELETKERSMRPPAERQPRPFNDLMQRWWT